MLLQGRRLLHAPCESSIILYVVQHITLLTVCSLHMQNASHPGNGETAEFEKKGLFVDCVTVCIVYNLNQITPTKMISLFDA